MLVYHGARWVRICEICAVKPVHNVYEINTYLVLVANVAKFVLFARALCERRRICIIRCTFLEFSVLTHSILAWCGFSEFRVICGSLGELREIWLIRSNCPGFPVDGQRSEMELDSI